MITWVDEKYDANDKKIPNGWKCKKVVTINNKPKPFRWKCQCKWIEMKFYVDESDLQMTNMNFENEINAQIKIYFQEWNWSQVGNFILFFPNFFFKIWAKFSKILENLLQICTKILKLIFFPFSFFWVTTMKNFTPCPPKKNADHKMKLTNWNCHTTTMFEWIS